MIHMHNLCTYLYIYTNVYYIHTHGPPSFNGSAVPWIWIHVIYIYIHGSRFHSSAVPWIWIHAIYIYRHAYTYMGHHISMVLQFHEWNHKSIFWWIHISMNPWFHESRNMELQNYGTMNLYFDEFIFPWIQKHGTTELWNHKSIFWWIHISMNPWLHESRYMELQNYGITNLYYKSMFPWTQNCRTTNPMEPWIHGTTETWIHGNTEPWIRGITSKILTIGVPQIPRPEDS